MICMDIMNAKISMSNGKKTGYEIINTIWKRLKGNIPTF